MRDPRSGARPACRLHPREIRFRGLSILQAHELRIAADEDGEVFERKVAAVIVGPDLRFSRTNHTRPDEPDPPLHGRPEPLAPGGNSHRVRLQVGNRRENIRERGAKHERQAEEWAVVVKRRQRRAAHDERGNARPLGEQSRRRRLHFGYEPRAERRDLGDVAAELQHVAESLLGVHQERTPRERNFA